MKRILAWLFVALVCAQTCVAATPGQKVVLLDGVAGWSFLGSSIDLNFARNAGSCAVNRIAKSCQSLLSTTRASTGYGQWLDGHLSLFAANLPRITDQGLLVEQAATNFCPHSQTFESWTASTASVTTAFAAAPDGTNTAENFVPANGSNGVISQTLSTGLTAATSYEASVYFNPALTTLDQVTVYFGDSGPVGVDRSGVTITVGTLATAAFTAGIGAAPTNILLTRLAGTNWYRLTFTFLPTVNVSASDVLAIRYLAASADGVKGAVVWGAEVELGTFPTSYIPTTTVAVTRAADSVTINNINLVAPYSFFIAVTSSAKADSDFVIGGTNTNYSGLNGSAGTGRSFVVESSVTTASVTSTGTFTVGSPFKLAGRYATNDVNSSLNGGIGTHDTSVNPPTLSALGFGRSTVTSGFGSTVGAVYFARTAVFANSGLADAQMQALTR